MSDTLKLVLWAEHVRGLSGRQPFDPHEDDCDDVIIIEGRLR
jgi:hypothetical protein